MLNFSCVLIARNEEKTLPRMLASLERFKAQGGEVIVLDTGSSDETARVARDWGCKVTEVGSRFIRTIDEKTATAINKKYAGDDRDVITVGDTLFDYSGARNYAASLASKDMVAMPDCDEAFTCLDIDKVSQLIRDGVEQFEYNFVFSHDQFGNEAVKFLHSKFYNRKKMVWLGIIHEVLQGNAERRFVGEDVIKLEHWQNQGTDRTGYLKGLALDCYENPRNDRHAHYFARELMWKGYPKSAVQEFMRHIAMEKWPAERAQSMIYIGDITGDTSWYHKSFELEPSRREPLIRLAEHAYREGNAQKVVSYATAALEIAQSNFYANDLAHYAQTPHELAYWGYWQLGDKQKSAEHWLRAYRYQPLNPKYLHDARFYLELPTVSFIVPTLKREEGLKRCLASIEALNYPRELIDVWVKVDNPRIGVPRRVKQGVEATQGELIVYGSNDVEFTPESLIVAYIEGAGKALVAFNTGDVYPDEGNICEHFLIKRSILERIGGEVFDTEFHHVGVDNLLWAKCKKLGEAVRCTNAKVIHHHFTRGGPMDEVYDLAYSHADEDRALLQTKLAAL